MPTVYVPKVYDTNIQKNYNLPNVALTINGVETNSSATTFNMNNTGGTFSVIAQKKHYNSYGRNGCSIVSEYDCSVCGAPVIGGEGTLCPNCGEPLTTEGKTAKLRVAADSTGKILMTREVSDICMTEGDFKDIVSGASPSKMLSGLNYDKRLIMNAKSYGGSTVTGWVNTYLSSKIEMSANTATGSDKKAFKIKSSFVPKPIPEDYSDYKYIRVISGKTHNINSSEQTINSVIRTNIPLPYNFVSASSVNWITNFRYFEDLHDPDFSLIKVTANVSENDSLTDDRSGVITISDSTYGVSGAITVSQSAKTGPSEYNINFETSVESEVLSSDDDDNITVHGGNERIYITGYTAKQFFAASSFNLENIPASSLAPSGSGDYGDTNITLTFNFDYYLGTHTSDLITIISPESTEGSITFQYGVTTGQLHFNNMLGTESLIKITISCAIQHSA